MMLAGDQLNLDVHHREAGDDAKGQHTLDALFDAGDVFGRHGVADDPEFETLAWLVRLDDKSDVRELAFRAENFLVSVLHFDALGHALAERHL